MATSREIIAANADLKRLLDDGYEIAVKGSHLLISSIPYLDAVGSVCRGVLVLELNLKDDLVTAPPKNHVAHFAGTKPHYSDRTPIAGIIHSEGQFNLGAGIVAKFMFSSRPAEPDPDFHHKVTRYVDILSGPVKLVDPDATAQTRRLVESLEGDCPFVFPDTNSARAQITAISSKFRGQKIVIVGLGGTGAYILDLAAKTPVQEIHTYEDDEFALHNSFRAPGAPTRDELRARPTKLDYLVAIYSRMHRGLRPHPERLTANNCGQLIGMDFVFLCLDPGPDKEHIVRFLTASKIPFIDTGVGVEAVGDKLLGQVNTIIVTPDCSEHVAKVPVKSAAADDLYASNIQIAELNMLSAANAIIRWKKHVGFYANERHEHESTYTIGPNMLTNEETHPPVRREVATAA